MFFTVKAICSAIGFILLGFVTSQILFANFLLGFFLLISVFLFFFGDFIILYKALPYKAGIEPTPKGFEIMELQLLNGNIMLINTLKGAQGKRSFYINKNDASVINDGKSQVRFPGGNIGFRAHEMYDGNICPKRCKALEQMPGDNIKEMYYLLKQKIGFGKKHEAK